MSRHTHLLRKGKGLLLAVCMVAVFSAEAKAFTGDIAAWNLLQDGAFFQWAWAGSQQLALAIPNNVNLELLGFGGVNLYRANLETALAWDRYNFAWEIGQIRNANVFYQFSDYLLGAFR